MYHLKEKIRNISESKLAIQNNEIVKPPKFDGSTSLYAFFCQFEAASNINGWPEHKKAAMLLISLRGKAADIFHSFPDGKYEDYSFIKSKLLARFGDEHLRQVYRSEIMNRCQKQEETLQELLFDI